MARSPCASGSPVADDAVVVEVEGGEGDDLAAEGQGPGHLPHTLLTLELNIKKDVDEAFFPAEKNLAHASCIPTCSFKCFVIFRYCIYFFKR